jgi:hypothetical protein
MGSGEGSGVSSGVSELSAGEALRCLLFGYASGIVSDVLDDERGAAGGVERDGRRAERVAGVRLLGRGTVGAAGVVVAVVVVEGNE